MLRPANEEACLPALGLGRRAWVLPATRQLYSAGAVFMKARGIGLYPNLDSWEQKAKDLEDFRPDHSPFWLPYLNRGPLLQTRHWVFQAKPKCKLAPD